VNANKLAVVDSYVDLSS